MGAVSCIIGVGDGDGDGVFFAQLFAMWFYGLENILWFHESSLIVFPKVVAASVHKISVLCWVGNALSTLVSLLRKWKSLRRRRELSVSCGDGICDGI